MKIIEMAIVAALMVSVCGTAAADSLLPMYENGAVDFVKELTIKTDADTGDDVLIWPIDMCVDMHQNILVLDYKLQCIKKFNSEGKYVMTFARQGEGPGEINRAHRITLAPSGNLLVFDGRNKRLTWFDKDGQYVDSQSIQGSVSHLEASKDGSIFILARYTYTGWIDKGRLYKILRLSNDLQSDTPIDSAYVKDHQIAYENDKSVFPVGAPYVARLRFGVLPSGNIIVGRGDEYKLTLLSPELKPIREITRDVAPLDVSQEHKDRYYANYDDEPNLQKHVRKNVSFPAHLPFFTEIYVDDKGNILVERSLESKTEDAAIYDVFAEDGNYVNQVEMIRLDASTVFNQNHVYIARVPEDDFPSITRYRLEASKQK